MFPRLTLAPQRHFVLFACTDLHGQSSRSPTCQHSQHRVLLATATHQAGSNLRYALNLTFTLSTAPLTFFSWSTNTFAATHSTQTPCQTKRIFRTREHTTSFTECAADLILMDRLIDSLYQARRLLHFVTTGPGLPGQYRINPTASLSSRNLAIIHNIPPGFPLPPGLSSRSPSPAPRTPPQDAERFHHHWTGPPPQTTPATNINTATRIRQRSRSRDTRSG